MSISRRSILLRAKAKGHSIKRDGIQNYISSLRDLLLEEFKLSDEFSKGALETIASDLTYKVHGMMKGGSSGSRTGIGRVLSDSSSHKVHLD